jgi:hypothetical protein
MLGTRNLDIADPWRTLPPAWAGCALRPSGKTMPLFGVSLYCAVREWTPPNRGRPSRPQHPVRPYRSWAEREPKRLSGHWVTEGGAYDLTISRQEPARTSMLRALVTRPGRAGRS